MNDNPRAVFARFEKVVVVGGRRRDYLGDMGTIIWRDLVRRRTGSDRPPHWVYVVDLISKKMCGTFLESDIESQGEFDTEEAHLGQACEISLDVVVDDDDEFVEGSYRLPGRFWEVFIMSKKDVAGLQHQHSTWDSGIAGTTFEVPASAKLDKSYVLAAMDSVFGNREWTFVDGPDSIVLR